MSLWDDLALTHENTGDLARSLIFYVQVHTHKTQKWWHYKLQAYLNFINNRTVAVRWNISHLYCNRLMSCILNFLPLLSSNKITRNIWLVQPFRNLPCQQPKRTTINTWMIDSNELIYVLEAITLIGRRNVKLGKISWYWHLQFTRRTWLELF